MMGPPAENHMSAKILSWARLVLLACVLLLNVGILVAALVSERSRFDTNEVILLLAVVGLGFALYREFVRVSCAEADDGELADDESRGDVARKTEAINDARSSGPGSLINRLKKRRALTLVVLLCVLFFPVALVGIPAVLDGRPLSGREILLVFLLEIVVVACSVIALRRVNRLLR